jgi:hypothetical protein
MSRLLLVLAAAACATAGQSAGDASHHTGDGPSGGDGGIDSSRDAPPGACATPTTGMIATWSFIGESGSQASTSAGSAAMGITAGPVSRSAGLIVANGVGSINSSGWPTTTSLDPTKYYTFAVTPDPGCVLDLSSLAIDTKTSSTGPTLAVVATSADSFGQTSPVSLNTAGTSSLLVTGATGMVELRVFGYKASASTGTMRIQNTLTLNGTLR